MATANDPPPLAGFPWLGPDGAKGVATLGGRRHVSQLLSAQVCAHSPAGSGAPSHLELRHSLQVLGCSAGGRPLPPPGLIARHNSGPGLRPTALGCRLGPLVVAGSGQWAGAPPPPHLGVILGPSTRPNPALQRAEFFRIFGACGAAPRGGGGAPPTTLILLRNQRKPPSSRRPHARDDAGERSGPVLGLRLAKNREKFSFFLRKVVFVSGWTNGGCGNRLRRCGRRRRAGPPPPPMPEVCDARGGALTGPVPSRWMVLGLNLRGAAGDTPRGRAAFGSRKRPPPLRICDTPARDCRPLL